MKNISRDYSPEHELKVSENTPTTSHGHFNTPINISDDEEGFGYALKNAPGYLQHRKSSKFKTSQKKDLATVSHAA